MKKNIAFALGIILILTLSLTSCGGENTSYCDDDFLNDMAKGLEARWEFSDSAAAEKMDEDEVMTTAIAKELDIIGSYSDGTFKDTKLQEYAISYINALNKQNEALEYYDADYFKYCDMFEAAYIERCQLIVNINKEYGIPVSSKYQDTLDDMSTTGNKADEKDNITKAIEKQIKNADITMEDDNLVMVIENTTDKTLVDVDFQIKYYDADGVKIETDDYYIEDWAPGEKTKVSFWTYDIGYETYEIVIDYIEY